jgi:hypothetical protein
MRQTIAILALLPFLAAATPAAAVTNAEKAETCKFGADDQKLAGAKRKAFLAKCMANRNDKRGPATAAKKPTKPAGVTTAPPPAGDDKY